MTSVRHSLQTEENGIHKPFNWVWADGTARSAEVVTEDDVDKLGFQIDNRVIWQLVDHTGPDWQAINPEYSEINTSNPPTKAQLNAEFVDAMPGTIVMINDSGLGTNGYLCWFDSAGDWWVHTATKAV